jgi:hypothetical protein
MVAVGETDMGVWVEEEAEAMTDSNCTGDHRGTCSKK